MRNRVRLHSLIKSSSRNRTFSWMLISQLHLWSRVCPPHHYASLLLLSSLLTRQPLRSLPPIFSFMLSFVTHSANTDPGCCWRWGLQEAFIAWAFLGETSWGKQLRPNCGFFIQGKCSNHFNNYRIFQISSCFYSAYDQMCMSASAHASWYISSRTPPLMIV